LRLQNPQGAFYLERCAGGVAFARRGTKDRGKHREAAGAIADANDLVAAEYKVDLGREIEAALAL